MHCHRNSEFRLLETTAGTLDSLSKSPSIRGRGSIRSATPQLNRWISVTVYLIHPTSWAGVNAAIN